MPIPVTPAQAEFLLRSLKHLGAKYQAKAGKEIYSLLLARFKAELGAHRYDMLPAVAYEKALAWIADRSTLPLRDRILATLQLGPQPHPYRRIKPGKDGNLQLAVQDWRVDFKVTGQQVQVLRNET